MKGRPTEELAGGLVVVAGHAIYFASRWHGGFPGEEPFYARHVEAGFRLLVEEDYEFLALSGGNNRPQFEKETRGLSEGEGMMNYAVETGLCSPADDRIIVEKWARDSMENLLFSILAFANRTRQWPRRVGVVSWNSKGLRFHLIAAGMQLGGRIFFHGIGDYTTQTDLERACAAEARFNAAIVDVTRVPPAYRLADPLQRNETEFASKRWARMPGRYTPDAAGNRKFMQEVKKAYAPDNAEVRSLVDQIEQLTPGDGWKHIPWPWLREGRPAQKGC
jgi:hypothetical protein